MIVRQDNGPWVLLALTLLGLAIAATVLITLAYGPRSSPSDSLTPTPTPVQVEANVVLGVAQPLPDPTPTPDIAATTAAQAIVANGLEQERGELENWRAELEARATAQAQIAANLTQREAAVTAAETAVAIETAAIKAQREDLEQAVAWENYRLFAAYSITALLLLAAGLGVIVWVHAKIATVEARVAIERRRTAIVEQALAQRRHTLGNGRGPNGSASPARPALPSVSGAGRGVR